MKLVVGLGNPGARYNFTRHNVGFLVLDFYFKAKGLEWKKDLRLAARWGREGDTIFIEPQEFYNDSGRAVAQFVRYYKIELADILVICDNFDLEFGRVRYRSAGSAGGNNGLKSIDACLGSSEYPRIRVGTGNDVLRKRLGDVEFVLSRFTDVERGQLPEILRGVAEKIEDFCG